MASPELQQTRPSVSVAMTPRPLWDGDGPGPDIDRRARPTPTTGHDFGAVRARSAGMSGPPVPAGEDPRTRVEAPSLLDNVLASAGQPLPAAVRAIVEPRFGRRFDDIRIHVDAQAAASARELDANAWTYGSHVAFGDGRFDPNSRRGMWLLSHELAHAIQQSAAPALARPSLASVDAGDRAADLAADAVIAGGPDPCAAALARGTARRRHECRSRE